MQTLYEIIKSLQNAQGSINKQAILDANAGNELFRKFMNATYNVGINYYIKKLPIVHTGNMATVDEDFIAWIVSAIAGRKYTGNTAVAALKSTLACMDAEGQELVSLMIKRSVGAGVGDTMVLKTWPDLYFIPPYQRCSLLDDKAKTKFAALPWFYQQQKMDGMFAFGVKGSDGTSKLITRAGSIFPTEFAERILQNVPNGSVLIGELLVHEHDKEGGNGVHWTLDRKTGNGILNSVLKDGEGLGQEQWADLTAWDLISEAEFAKGKSTRKLKDRLTDLNWMIQTQYPMYVNVAETHQVVGLAAAYAINSTYTAKGLEGTVIKDPDSLWKDGTAKDIVKLKVKFEAEYRCKRVIEGEGKAKGMAGAIEIATEDDLLECNCGTGFSDKQRKEFFDNPELIVDKIVMLSANDIIQSRDTRKKPALSLPVFEEIRHDKTVANTLADVLAALEAARQ